MALRDCLNAVEKSPDQPAWRAISPFWGSRGGSRAEQASDPVAYRGKGACPRVSVGEHHTMILAAMAPRRRPHAHPRGRQRIGRGRPAHRGESRAMIESRRLRARVSGRRCAPQPPPDHRRRRTSPARPCSSPMPRGTRSRSVARRRSPDSSRRQAMSDPPGPTRFPGPRND